MGWDDGTYVGKEGGINGRETRRWDVGSDTTDASVRHVGSGCADLTSCWSLLPSGALGSWESCFLGDPDTFVEIKRILKKKSERDGTDSVF